MPPSSLVLVTCLIVPLRILPRDSGHPDGVVGSVLMMDSVCIGLSSCADAIPILMGEVRRDDSIYIMPCQIIGLGNVKKFLLIGSEI
jgi:hypothetical protein